MSGRMIGMLIVGLLLLAGLIFWGVSSASAQATGELPDDGGPTAGSDAAAIESTTNARVFMARAVVLA